MSSPSPFVTEDEKILLSDLLFFMQNKLNSISNDDIVRICDEFYDDELIASEKERFFDAIGKPVAQRHQVVSDTLALLLFIGVDLPLGSRAAAPIGDEVL